MPVDGNGEPVDCGAGTDVAAVDVADQLTGCEILAIANLLVDADLDGFPTGAGKDCDDTNPAINPGAQEMPRQRGRRELRRATKIRSR